MVHNASGHAEIVVSECDADGGRRLRDASHGRFLVFIHTRRAPRRPCVGLGCDGSLIGLFQARRHLGRACPSLDCGRWLASLVSMVRE